MTIYLDFINRIESELALLLLEKRLDTEKLFQLTYSLEAFQKLQKQKEYELVQDRNKLQMQMAMKDIKSKYQTRPQFQQDFYSDMQGYTQNNT